ncbi:SDR family NAD(P)-dependent oxidoreductase [Streptomyces sp. NPDC087263]|uniref:SDR family NAD(P)-dependent oxidoreductase n=1 Tax=Streptomyces sp. NPDC087263 TaxID=3365773 RepID=UPI0037FC322C
MDLNLSSKTAVVTGAGRGIGLSVVETLIGEGMRVIGATRTRSPELKDSGAHPVIVDLATAEGALELGKVAAAEFGAVDVLVNNVGGAEIGNHKPRGFLFATDADWLNAFEINFLSAVRVTKALVPLLFQQNRPA